MPDRRIWSTDYGTVCLRTQNPEGETIVREFWVPPGGGYVREIDEDHPGTLGSQVCNRLGIRGPTLSATRATLAAVIRTEYQRSMRFQDREARAWLRA